MAGEAAIERALSPSEKLWWILDHECRVNFVMHARVSGELTEEIIRPALKAVQARHPLLRVRIEKQGRHGLVYRADGVPNIPLRIVDRPEEAWIEEAEAELNDRFEVDKGPLVRCVLIRHGALENTVLLSFHHSIGDAMSGAFLIRDLFQSAALVREGKEYYLPLLEPKREMDAYYPSWARGFSGRLRYYGFAFRVFYPLIKWGRPRTPVYDRKAAPEERRARIVAHSIDARIIEKLHERANLEGTTLHGALLAAQILAIAHDRQEQKEKPYFLGSPVNLRKRLAPQVGQDVGFFVTMGASINKAGLSTDFWRLADQVRQSLWECVARGDPFVYTYQHRDMAAILSLLGLGRIGRKTYGRLLAMANMGGMAFSNIGKVDIETVQGPFNIETLGFAASGSSLSPLLGFAATIKNRSTWNFVGMEPMLSREHTQRIAAKAMELLHDAVS